MMDTEEIIRRIREGDDGAFTVLVRQWESRLFNFAMRYMGNPQDAQDVMQETFLSVFRAIDTLKDSRSFSSWLYRILLNHCRYRWRSRPDEVSLDEKLDPASPKGDARMRAMAFPGNDHSRVEMRDVLGRALRAVSEDHRAAILLKEYLGLSLEEVAAVMDCPLSTAKSRLYHGLKGVQRSLEQMGVKPAGSSERLGPQME